MRIQSRRLLNGLIVLALLPAVIGCATIPVGRSPLVLTVDTNTLIDTELKYWYNMHLDEVGTHKLSFDRATYLMVNLGPREVAYDIHYQGAGFVNFRDIKVEVEVEQHPELEVEPQEPQVKVFKVQPRVEETDLKVDYVGISSEEYGL